MIFPRRPWRSLIFQLLCLAGTAATVPALVIALIFSAVSSRALLSSLQHQQTEVARRLAGQINDEILDAHNILRFVAHTSSLMHGSRVEQKAALSHLFLSMPDFQQILLVSPSGMEVLKVTGRGADYRLIHRHENFTHSFVSAPFFSGQGLPSILLSEPLSEGGRLNGALVAKMSFAGLGKLIQETRIGERGDAFIVSNRGAVVAHPNADIVRSHQNASALPVVRQWLTNPLLPTGFVAYRDARNVSWIGLAYPIPLLQSAVVIEEPRADVYAPLAHVRNQWIAWTLIWVIVFMGIAMAVAWRILKPLRQLQGAAEQIARGHMDVQLHLHTHQEVEELGAAFTHMAESLKASEGMRRDLISMIVHDLKSPLASILASLDYQISGELGPVTEDQRKFLSIARRSGAELLNLIQDLLDVAKMEEGKLKLVYEMFDPVPWIESVMVSFEAQAEASQKKLRAVLPQGLSAIQGDRMLLTRVLSNLLSNALRHTRQGIGEIIILAAHDHERLTLDVRDNGEGISTEDQKRIFEKFEQAPRKRAHLRTGTGLGLTFCKMAVEAHGGFIAVHSVAGQGSTFTVTIPIASSQTTDPKPQTRESLAL